LLRWSKKKAAPSYTANDTLMTSSEVTGNQWYFNGNMMPGETGQV